MVPHIVLIYNYKFVYEYFTNIMNKNLIYYLINLLYRKVLIVLSPGDYVNRTEITTTSVLTYCNICFLYHYNKLKRMDVLIYYLLILYNAIRIKTKLCAHIPEKNVRNYYTDNVFFSLCLLYDLVCQNQLLDKVTIGSSTVLIEKYINKVVSDESSCTLSM